MTKPDPEVEIEVILLSAKQGQSLLMKLKYTEKEIVKDFLEKIKFKKKGDYTILQPDKEERALDKQLVKECVVEKKLFVKLIRFLIPTIKLVDDQYKQIRLMKCPELDSDLTLGQVAEIIKKSYNMVLAIIQRNGSRAPLGQKISQYLNDNHQVIVKQFLSTVVLFCEQNIKQTLTMKADINWTLKDFKDENKDLDNKKFLDKRKKIATGSLKLIEISTLKDNIYYIQYKQFTTEEAKRAKLLQIREDISKLEKVNDDLKKKAGQSSEAARKYMTQASTSLQTEMKRLTQKLTFYQQKDFKLKENITRVEKQESNTFITRLRQESKLYTTDMLLEQSKARIFSPYFKEKPLVLNRRIVDFKRSLIETTNYADFQQRQASTQSKSVVKSISKQVNQTIDKLQTSAKIGGGYSLVKVSLQASYSTQNQNMTQDEKKQLNSQNRMFVVYNALKTNEAYHINQQNIALKPEVRKQLSRLYDNYESGIDKNRLKKEVIQFYRKFGTHLEIGTYIFGCRYSFTSMAQSLQNVQMSKLATVNRVVKNIGLAGGVSAGVGAFSVQTGFSINNMTGKTNSKAQMSEKSNQSFSFQINYKLDGLEIKNRDEWRQFSGIYKKGWRVLGYQNVRLVRIVEIIGNPLNRIDNQSYKKSFDNFLDQLLRIEEKIGVNDYYFTKDGVMEIYLKQNLKINGSIQQIYRSSVNFIQENLSFQEAKSFKEEILKERLSALLQTCKENESFEMFTENMTIRLTKRIFALFSAQEKYLQLKIKIFDTIQKK